MSASELVLIRWHRSGTDFGGAEGERVVLGEYAPLLRFLREGGHPESVGLIRGRKVLTLKIAVRRKFADMVFGIVERRFGPLAHRVSVAGTFSGDPLLDDSASPYRAGMDLATRIGLDLLENTSARTEIRSALEDSQQEVVDRVLKPLSYTFRRTPAGVFWPLMERRSPDGSSSGFDVLRNLVLGFR